MNPEIPKLSQPQHHKGPNASTNHGTPKWSQRQHYKVPNASTNPETLKLSQLHALEIMCNNPVCSVARQDVGRLWAINLLGEIGEFHVILPGNRRLMKISHCCLTRFTFVTVAYCIMSPALMYQFFSTQVSLRHHTLHIATLRLHTRNSMLLHLECN